MKNKLCFHRYDCLGYYPEALHGNCLILVYRCRKCGKEKTKAIELVDTNK